MKNRVPFGGLRARAPRRVRGVTLIEILVAIVLLSIGLLGLAGLQLRGMQVNQGSALRTQAALMAEDLADRMRADATAANPVNPAGFYGTFTPAGAAAAAPAAMQDWLQNNLNSLPTGVGDAAVTVPCQNSALPCVKVCCVAAAGTALVPVQIDVYWNDARAAVAATAANAAGSNKPTTTVGQYTVLTYLQE